MKSPGWSNVTAQASTSLLPLRWRKRCRRWRQRSILPNEQNERIWINSEDFFCTLVENRPDRGMNLAEFPDWSPVSLHTSYFPTVRFAPDKEKPRTRWSPPGHGWRHSWPHRLCRSTGFRLKTEREADPVVRCRHRRPAHLQNARSFTQCSPNTAVSFESQLPPAV